MDLFDNIAKRYKQYVDDFHEDLRKRENEIDSLKTYVSLAKQSGEEQRNDLERAQAESANLRVLISLLDVLATNREKLTQILCNPILFEEDSIIASEARSLYYETLGIRSSILEAVKKDNSNYDSLLAAVIDVKKEAEKLLTRYPEYKERIQHL